MAALCAGAIFGQAAKDLLPDVRMKDKTQAQLASLRQMRDTLYPGLPHRQRRRGFVRGPHGQPQLAAPSSFFRRWLGQPVCSANSVGRAAALDGHESHASYRRHCPGCLERTRTGQTERTQSCHRQVTLMLLPGARPGCDPVRFLPDHEPRRAGEDEAAAVQEFLAANPKVRFHFTPTYSSWLNQVELWFAKTRRQVVSRGIFKRIRAFEITGTAHWP